MHEGIGDTLGAIAITLAPSAPDRPRLEGDVLASSTILFAMVSLRLPTDTKVSGETIVQSPGLPARCWMRASHVETEGSFDMANDEVGYLVDLVAGVDDALATTRKTRSPA